MAANRKIAMSSTITAIVVIIVLVVAGGAGYFIGHGSTTSASTVTTTVGGSATTITQTVTQTATSGGVPAIDSTLASQCASEGNSVTVYGVMDTGDWQKTMSPIWSHEFPQISVNYVGLSPSDIATRGLTEFQASHVQADVFYDTLGPVTQLITANAVQPYKNYVESFENYSATDPNNMWHPGFGLPIVIIYNKNLVTSTSQLPTTYEQLNSSTWAGGKLVIDKPGILNVAGTLFASLYSTDFGGNNATWSKWMKSVAAGHPTYTTSGGDVYTAVSSGANPIGVGLLNDVLSGNSPVVKVDWLPKTYTLPVMSAMAKSAPHPFCAELFIQWSSSFTGQSALALTGRTPLMSVAAGKYFTIIPTTTDLIPGGTSGTYYSNPNGWASYFDSIFGA
jgi:ABC-type Fe3+ transport system substrate-binding protein